MTSYIEILNLASKSSTFWKKNWGKYLTLNGTRSWTNSYVEIRFVAKRVQTCYIIQRGEIEVIVN